MSMKNLQVLSDKAAISLSLLCSIHCLAIPLLVVLLPSIVALPLEGETFHLWMLYAVVPISAYALTMGCKSHKRYRVLLLGGLGLLILAATALAGHAILGEMWEKIFTVLGTSIMAVGHFWNYRLCQHHANCGCSDQNESCQR